MTYDPRRRADPPGSRRRDQRRDARDRNAQGRDSGGLGTRAALALAAVLLVAGLLATGALAGNATPRTAAAAPSGSPVALVPTPGASAPTTSAPPDGTTPAPASSGPGASPASTPTPTPKPTLTPPSQGGAIPAATLQAKLDAIRARLNIPGVTVAILWDDGRQWLGASGLRDVAANEPMTTDTAVALASVSKTFTAAVVLQLVDEGKLALDESVAPLLPEYALDKRITLRMLLDHTSGLPDYFLNVKINHPLQADPNATWTPPQALRFVPRGHLPPGKRWLYSNTNYLLLGELVTRVTGRPLAAEVRDRLLDPLGLDHAWYQAVEPPEAPGVVAYRIVSAPGGKVRYVPVAKPTDVMPFRAVVTAAGGAGSIAATAEDAARWMRAWAGGKELSAGLEAQVLADIARTAKLGSRIPYGLGIQALPLAGRQALGHSGRYLGIRNVVRYLPADGVTIAVLTNQSVVDPARVATALLKLILPLAAQGGASPGASPAGSYP